MRRWTVLWAAVVLAGCGGGERPQATPTAQAVKPARTAEQCKHLWNTYGRGGIEDYLVEAEAKQALVAFVNGECLVAAPVEPGARRIYVWVARGGRAPWGLPSQRNIPAGRDLNLNVQVTEEGKLE